MFTEQPLKLSIQATELKPKTAVKVKVGKGN